jgi:hypothetical protein
MSNSVKLYSNGTAVINREYEIKDGKPLDISIPVKKDDLDEVVASISVYGNVQLPEPPSYTPVNADLTKLQIDVNNVTKSLATKLAGSKVEVGVGNNPIKGKLMGVQTYQQETNGSVFDRFRVVVLTEQGVRAFEDKDVSYISFTEPAVQSEVEKVLQKQYEGIKPDSSFVSLKVVPKQGAEGALVSYAIPCAAWKIRYQLRTVNGKVELEGQAVVDNDTDDDWRDSIISVITGEPIAFSTDLAEIRRPQRQRINVVSDKAQGAVQLDEAVRPRSVAKSAVRGMAMAACAPMGGGGLESYGAESVAMGFDDESGGDIATFKRISIPMNRAEEQQADVRDSGDFSVFTAPNPVTVLSKKSAIIPMFRAGLNDSKTVLFYKEENDPRRPFRSIKLKNETAHSLGKGICEVFLDGDFQGKCVLEACKPGEDVILVHAKETGVKVFKKSDPVEQRRVSIKFNKGRIITEESYRQRTVYSVENVKNEEFRFEAEYRRTWQGSAIKASDNSEVTNTANGVRLGCTLAANGEQTLEVVETYVRNLEYSASPAWLESQILAVKNPLSKNKGIQKCVELQKKISTLQEQVAENEEQVEAIKEEQERLNGMIPNASAEQQREWQTELSANEKELRRLSRTDNPRIKKEIAALETELNETLASLSASWTEEGRAEE